MTFGDELLDITPKAQSTKEKIQKLDFIKIKIFYSVRDTAKRIKRQRRLGKNICKTHI